MVEDYLGWQFKIIYIDGWRLLRLTVEDSLGWRLKTLKVDGWSFLKLTVLQGDMNCEHSLTGCQAFMRHATCHFSIGFCTESKRRFVFHASLIYITHFSSLISTLFSQNILSEHHCQPCQSTLSNIYTRQLYNRRLFVTQRAVSIYYFFQVLHFVLTFC